VHDANHTDITQVDRKKRNGTPQGYFAHNNNQEKRTEREQKEADISNEARLVNINLSRTR
jgi:hypothetical protein